VRIEAHLIDFDEDLYGKDINVVFWKKIRGEISFNNLKDLSLQIGIDADEALEISKEKVKTCINLQNLST
jgi:riboflavin kinase/FMN adenylyltransferase